MAIMMPERLEHARAALTAYLHAKGEKPPEGPWHYEDTDVSDLIADLLHLQKRLGLRGTKATLQTAMLHFEAEEEEGHHYPCALCDEVHVPNEDRSGEAEPACNSRCQVDRELELIEIR